MDLNIKNLYILNIGGVEVWITETIVNTWIIMAMLIAFAVIVRIRFRKFEEVPGTRLQNAVELMVEAFDGLIRSSAGENFMHLGNWYFSVFAFALVSNLSGLLGMRPPTADWATTFALAFSTLVLIQVMGVRYRKGAYLKGFFEPFFLFFPLNVIGEIARPISLSFRMFGNILSGFILMGLLYAMAPIYLQFGIPAPLHAFFDVFGGLLQTYIFCVLSMTFIGAASTAED